MPLPQNPTNKLQTNDVLVYSKKHFKIETPDELYERLEKPKELILKPREMFLKIGSIISTNGGSAYMEYGGTKLHATVEPPKEMNSKKSKNPINNLLGVITCQLQYSPVAITAENSSDIKQREMFLSMALCKALEPAICRNEFPNFELEIKVTVLDDDGCVLSTAINCCGVALIECGVATYGICCATTLCFYKEITFVNPSKDIENMLTMLCEKTVDDEYALLVVSSLPSMGQVTECFLKGYLTPDKFQTHTEYALKVNVRISEVIQSVLRNYLKQHIAAEEQVFKEDPTLQESDIEMETDFFENEEKWMEEEIGELEGDLAVVVKNEHE